MSPIADRKEQAAEIAQADHVNRVVLEIQELLNRGILIDIDVHGIGIFQIATSWAEWGFADDDPRKSHMRKGSRNAAQDLHKKLRSAEVRLRNLAARYGRKITGLGGWSWIPYTVYDEFTTEWDRINGELTATRDEIISRRPELVTDLAADMAAGARRAWAAIEAQRPEGAGPFVLIENGDTYLDIEAYIEHERQRAHVIFPTAEDIKRKVYAVYHNAILMTSAELLAEHAAEKEARRDAAQAALDEQTAHDESHRRQLQAELNLAEMEAEHTARVNAMRDAEIQRAREMIQDVKSPWQDIIDQFRAEVNEKVVKLAQSLQRNGCLRGRSLGLARDLHQLYQVMASATDDRELEEKLRHLKDILDPAMANADVSPSAVTVGNALQDIITFTDTAAREVAQTSRAVGRRTSIDVIDL